VGVGSNIRKTESVPMIPAGAKKARPGDRDMVKTASVCGGGFPYHKPRVITADND